MYSKFLQNISDEKNFFKFLTILVFIFYLSPVNAAILTVDSGS